MRSSAAFLLSLITIFSTFLLPSLCEDVTVSIQVATSIAKTDRSFVCVTLDWWPADKCNYGMCPWHQSSVLNLVIYVSISMYCSTISCIFQYYIIFTINIHCWYCSKYTYNHVQNWEILNMIVCQILNVICQKCMI